MKLKFLGTTASIPDIHEDSPCFLVNDRYLFDCGFNVLGDLRETDCDIGKIDHIIFTHMHHDHYLGLASLLFYFIHSRVKDIKDLTILGPDKDVERVVSLAYSYLQLDLFYPDIERPKIIPLGESGVYETNDAVIKYGLATHPVDARCYRFISPDGSSLAISGDTMYREDMAPLFKGANALIHDSTLGYCEGCGNNGHSTLCEAIRIAKMADIPMLFPVHMSVQKAEDAVNKAKEETNVKLIAPKRGVIYTL